ncbi:hypothetical protein E4H04_12155, partial [Candidatus Bathyarchaeota archaeon]
YVRIGSLLVFGETIYSTGLSILTGLEKMEGRAVMDIIQGLVKGTLSPILVYLGMGINGALIGHVSSYLVSASIGIVLMLRSSRKIGELKSIQYSRSDLNLIFNYSLPRARACAREI